MIKRLLTSLLAANTLQERYTELAETLGVDTDATHAETLEAARQGRWALASETIEERARQARVSASEAQAASARREYMRLVLAVGGNDLLDAGGELAKQEDFEAVLARLPRHEVPCSMCKGEAWVDAPAGREPCIACLGKGTKGESYPNLQARLRSYSEELRQACDERDQCGRELERVTKVAEDWRLAWETEQKRRVEQLEIATALRARIDKAEGTLRPVVVRGVDETDQSLVRWALAELVGQKCPSCSGSGWCGDEACPDCEGCGAAPLEKTEGDSPESRTYEAGDRPETETVGVAQP
jgi:hypothetical protein